jgi:hypothetical protein
MPVFTLEAVQAQWGDALLLHWGEGDDLRTIMVDGGPGGRVSTDYLFPRLGQLRSNRERTVRSSSPYPLERIVVTHIDDDHIAGVIEVLGHIEDGFDELVSTKGVWHNAFGDVLDEDDPARVKAALTALDEQVLERLGSERNLEEIAHDVFLDPAQIFVTSGVEQGNELQRLANSLGLTLNEGSGLMYAPRPTLDFDGLTVTVVSPTADLLDDLRRYWQQELTATGSPQSAMRAIIAAYEDKSPPNLASIVFLAEYRGQKILMTGDARGDYVLAGLEHANMLAETALELDVLKLPHHGSIRDFEMDFFERLRARHYVVSANGRYGNPESETLRLLIESRNDDAFTIWLTNHDNQTHTEYRRRLDALFQGYWDRGRSFDVAYREADAFSLRVDTLDEFPW